MLAHLPAVKLVKEAAQAVIPIWDIIEERGRIVRENIGWKAYLYCSDHLDRDGLLSITLSMPDQSAFRAVSVLFAGRV